MSYNRKIGDKRKNKKEAKLSPYTKSRAFDSSCRCNGGCKYCASNRLHKINRERIAPGTVREEFNHIYTEFQEIDKELAEYFRNEE